MILDHPKHVDRILAGMWGFYNSRDRNLANKIFDLIKNPEISKTYLKSSKVGDQKFLKEYVYDLVKEKSIAHDSYACFLYGSDPFPTKRVGNCFVGSPNDGCNPNSTFNECPAKCRPKDHQDWISC